MTNIRTFLCFCIISVQIIWPSSEHFFVSVFFHCKSYDHHQNISLFLYFFSANHMTIIRTFLCFCNFSMQIIWPSSKHFFFSVLIQCKSYDHHQNISLFLYFFSANHIMTIIRTFLCFCIISVQVIWPSSAKWTKCFDSTSVTSTAVQRRRRWVSWWENRAWPSMLSSSREVMPSSTVPTNRHSTTLSTNLTV